MNKTALQGVPDKKKPIEVIPVAPDPRQGRILDCKNYLDDILREVEMIEKMPDATVEVLAYLLLGVRRFMKSLELE